MLKTDNGEHSENGKKLRKVECVLTRVTVGVGANGSGCEAGQTRGTWEPAEPCHRTHSR